MSSQHTASHNSSRARVQNYQSGLVPSSFRPLISDKRNSVPHSRIPVRVKDSSRESKTHFVPNRMASSFLPINLFSVPAILSHISQTDPAYIFTFLDKGTSQQAVLQPTFLTALEQDGSQVSWEVARSNMMLGLEAKVDITQVKPASVTENWLVFGLYLNRVSTNSYQEGTFAKVNPLEKQRFFPSDWVELDKNERNNLTDGSLSSSKESFDSCSEGEYLEMSLENEILCDDSGETNLIAPSLLLHTSQVLNQTFTVDKEPSTSLMVRPDCVHKYEVGVVVVSISSQYLHLIVQLGDSWARTDVDPLSFLVYVEGVRTREVFNVTMGAIGSMVVDKCVNCKLLEVTLASPNLLWFGDEPCVRGSPGAVVGREEGRMVVQLERTDTLVLFHGDVIEQMSDLQTKVLVWAWAKQLKNCAGTFFEGAALITRQEEDCADGDITEKDNTFGLLELSTEGIFSPIHSKLLEEAAYPHLKEKVTSSDIFGIFNLDSNEILDASLSVSFGSASESESVVEGSSMVVNPDLSIKHMEDASKLETTSNFMINTLEEIYFQALFWRISSKPDAIIDAQFDNVLAVNDLLHTYDDLVNEFDQMFGDVMLSYSNPDMVQHSSSLNLSYNSTCSLNTVPIDQGLSFECPADPIVIDPTLVRKMSHPLLSPIPEETGEVEVGVASDVEVFAGPSLSSTPFVRFAEDSDNSSQLSTSGSVSYGEIIPPMTDSGYYESFSLNKGSSCLESEAKSKLVRNVLDQFLEFTQFPFSRRNEVLNDFIRNFYKEEK
eukprot:GFUD01027631.1.p1 GENE.GFUD01027631.1~~GFUD01027631.1.p1  ORF type:complete len:775 (+),score=171.21 GFUD01027631.1:45-2369(+)